MLTVGQLARQFNLSRSTLLYYDSIGLLQPSGRSSANYRLYSQDDVNRMEKIALYRDAGIPLESIIELLDKQEDNLNNVLNQRLFSINDEIQQLRNQQQVILKILQHEQSVTHTRLTDKQTWVALLAAAGLDEAGMRRWHIEFERTSPQAHQGFLESLGIAEKEIDEIRHWSRAAQQDNIDSPCT